MQLHLQNTVYITHITHIICISLLYLVHCLNVFQSVIDNRNVRIHHKSMNIWNWLYYIMLNIYIYIYI